MAEYTPGHLHLHEARVQASPLRGVTGSAFCNENLKSIHRKLNSLARDNCLLNHESVCHQRIKHISFQVRIRSEASLKEAGGRQ